MAPIFAESIPIDEMVEIVCGYYGATTAAFYKGRRYSTARDARWTLIYILRMDLGMSYPSIAAALQLKDHSSAIYAMKNLDKRLEVIAKCLTYLSNKYGGE